MDACRLGLAVMAILTLLTTMRPEPTSAGAASALGAARAETYAGAMLAIPVGAFHHSRRVESYYCYPRNYWWFYRPYTTGQDGHERCMPYFHYPPYLGRSSSGSYIK
jgi:hypothetical protein